MSTKQSNTTSKERLQPAAKLGSAELVRLGELVSLLLVQLQSTTIPLPPAIKDAKPAWQTPPDFLNIGEEVRTIHVRLRGYSYRLSLARGKLFWEALNTAIYRLNLGKAAREHFQKGESEVEEEVPDVQPITLEEIAQEIVNGACADFGKPSPPLKEQAARVEFALALDSRCSDAYLLQGTLYEQAGSWTNAQASYERAMELAAEKLGTLAFSEESRRAERIHFWYSTGTREYMRPRAALAFLLWRKMGHLKEAIAHFQALLELNPRDNQNNGDALICCLLEAGDDEALGKELHRLRFYDGDTIEPQDVAGTVWHYTHACWLFRKSTEDRKKARSALKTAFKHNRYVPSFLLGTFDLPDFDELDAYSYGDSTEAALYANLAFKGWENTPGALVWLEEEARHARLFPMKDQEIPAIHTVPPQ